MWLQFCFCYTVFLQLKGKGFCETPVHNVFWMPYVGAYVTPQCTFDVFMAL